MIAALRDSYVEAVFFMGINERYPHWFAEELYNCTFTDESRFTFWVPEHDRRPDYHEKELVEDYSVFLRKSNGEIHLTNYDVVDELYCIFRSDRFDNSALLALNDDVIEYVECHGGHVVSGYPEWFYEYFTEAVNFPSEEESIFLDNENGDITITEHCVFLRNKFGEIRVVDYTTFIKYYDPDPGF